MEKVWHDSCCWVIEGQWHFLLQAQGFGFLRVLRIPSSCLSEARKTGWSESSLERTEFFSSEGKDHGTAYPNSIRPLGHHATGAGEGWRAWCKLCPEDALGLLRPLLHMSRDDTALQKGPPISHAGPQDGKQERRNRAETQC